jgi:hypothetical protein
MITSNEIAIDSKAREIIDNNLAKVQAIIRLAGDSKAEMQARANALWAADDLVEQVRCMLGKF